MVSKNLVGTDSDIVQLLQRTMGLTPEEDIDPREYGLVYVDEQRGASIALILNNVVVE